MKRFTKETILGLCFASHFCFAQENETLICKIEEVAYKLDLKIVVDGDIIDSWKSITYDAVDNDNNLIRYLDLLHSEYSKYPSGYFQRAHINTIVLTKNLKFRDQLRAAIPDPFKKQLFLSINGAYGIATRRYLAHVMHHELHHCAEYGIWKNMSYDWNEWLGLNIENFCYGSGGETAYQQTALGKTDFFSPTNPEKGFINRYSLTGDEEDRAELMAFLMTDSDQSTIRQLVKKDDIIYKKSLLLCELLSTFMSFTLPFSQNLLER
jgi:hypothetical protein